ncbi:S8 family serine peptidase [Reichenbachiella sp.]|uniref:S8 family serine peptidase n=1 Tax=Reichenbachiella sp. TaxID=2184521 RepID=UPI003297FE31
MRIWRVRIWVMCFVLIVLQCLAFRASSQNDYQTVYVKLNSEFLQPGARSISGNQLQRSDISALSEVISLEDLSYGFAHESSAGQRVEKKKSKYLDGMIKIKVNSDFNLEPWLKELESYSNVIYAEVEQPVELLLTPNDPNLSNQDYLTKIEAYNAWNVTQGNPSIVIAISDNGTDYGHEDLEDKLAYNISDPVNGIDDDNNGYVDDYLGWDLADGDNDPYGDTPNSNPSHGTLVAGIAAAKTNNGIGMAGVGYNSTYLPIKIFKSSSGSSSNSYESLIYAADQGCEVINLSWGSTGAYSQTLQDMVNYAVLEKDMVVVAAAGNTNADLDFYPASYDNVLSVGMTNIDDSKQANATYSYKIDLMAPGGAVYGTANEDTYATKSGSSFSSPQVAATAALVREVFPEMNAIQVMEQIRMTADDIYEVGSNSSYEGKLGKGRLNMYRAVSETNVASVRSYNYSYAGPFGQLVFRDDTVVVDISFANILRPVDNAKVSITSTSSYVEILNNEIALGSLGEFDSLKNVSINIRLKTDAPTNEKIGFRMGYSDVLGHDDFEYFEFTTAPSYLEMDNQNIELTVGSDGRLGYASDVLKDGNGLKYDTERRANFMGIMVGNDPDSISDNVINSFLNFTFEDDFIGTQNIKFIERDDADYYSLGTLSDNGADKPHGLLIEQEFLGWNDISNNDFFVAEYRVTNTKNFAKDNMKFGLYMDFNLEDSTKNFVSWDVTNKLAYTWSNDEPNLVVGVALITSHAAIVNAIDLFDQNELPIDVTNDFTDQLKYNFLTTEKTSAGGVSGYDVAQLVAADIGTLPAYGSEKIAYALVFGANLTELIDNVNKAKTKYTAFLNTPPLNMVVGTCKNEDLLLNNTNPISVYTDALASNLLGSGTNLNLGSYTANTSLYFKEIIGGYESDIYKMQVSIANPQTDFEASPEVLYLGDEPNNEVQFQDLSLGAQQWSWDFSNGSFSSVKNPRTSFNTVGSYQINFTSNTAIGCEESISKMYEVKERGAAPIISDQTVCHGSGVSITASNSNSLRFFHAENGGVPFYEGAEYNIAALSESVVYYVSSSATANESIRVPVALIVDPIKAGFTYLPDTLDFSRASLIRILDESVNSDNTVWSINGTNLVGGSSFVYDFDGLTSLSIVQQVTSDNGCSDNKESEVALQATSKGGIIAQSICEWETVIAQPQFGDYFVFYLDESKTEILDKGKSASFGPIRTDTSFFISNITNYLESDLIEFEINVDEFETKIVANPDSLFFETNRNASFAINNNDAISVKWTQDDGQQALVLAPTLTYHQTGKYILTAISSNANACTDTATIAYRVYQILDAQNLPESIALYPNPVVDELEIITSSYISDIRIVNVNGLIKKPQVHNKKGRVSVSVVGLPAGVFLVQGVINNEHFSLKFVKK